MSIYKNRTFLISLFIFIICNVILYLFIVDFHGYLSFNRYNYFYTANHFFSDPRIHYKTFDFLRALDQYDAQWYVKIASVGYVTYGNMGALTYQWFPFYPIIIFFVNLLFKNVELSAFIIANILLLANFISLYYVISKLYSQEFALRTNFLLFFFPFSIFFRSYFTEGLFLFLLIWFSYFTIQRKWIPGAICLTLLSITRPNGLFLFPLFFIFLYKDILRKQVSLKKVFLISSISVIGIVCWSIFCYFMTGDYLYWYHIHYTFFKPTSIIEPVIKNIHTLISFFNLPLHHFHTSKIDVGVFILGLAFIYKSKKFLKSELWLLSIILLLTPFLLKDFMSYTRYQTISFPIFLYLSKIVSREGFFIVSTLAFILLLIVSLFFVNWYWIG